MKRDCLVLSCFDRIVAYIQLWDVIVSLHGYSKSLLHSGIGLLGGTSPGVWVDTSVDNPHVAVGHTTIAVRVLPSYSLVTCPFKIKRGVCN